MINKIFPAEWAPQRFVQLTWPHADTDWAYMLDEVQACFKNIAREVAKRQQLLIVAPDVEDVRRQIADEVNMTNVTLVEFPSNDTWARDHGGITIFEDGKPVILDFQFNGWGLKFPSDKDNLITERLHRGGHLFGELRNCRNFVFEGGSIESDGEGTLLTTSECLLSPNRNATMTREEIEAYLLDTFGAKQLLWLDHGYLAGDDTDSHIDTLARLCPDNTILYVKCDDETDEHYEALLRMEEQLTTFRTLAGEPYRLIALPMARPAFEDDERIPATYANYLVINGAVLVPTYATELDALALAQVQKAFPNHEIVGVDCRELIRQHGSLHCVTMQYPAVEG
ncbi:MAG: agmatine deiminase family protein [Paludibacteraceae bacterium]|nr:agmatine deiminase family protein [Paludibacteraceae bacterium]